MQTWQRIRGLIFDLDGTLVDSGLDFDLIRREMELAPGRPLLEALAEMAEPRASQCWQILARHEEEGARRAQLMPGVRDFLAKVHVRRVRTALLTRNGRKVTLDMLARLGLDLDPVIAREDAAVKPDPAGIWRICEIWGLGRDEVGMLGDYLFDLEAGRRAGVRTVLYTRRRQEHEIERFGRADFYLDCFSRPEQLLNWLESGLGQGESF